MYSARGITKSYGGVVALKGVDLRVEPGEVHALLGSNGAGKSTLVKILAGAAQPDSGQLSLDGVPIRFATSREARAGGVALVSQELNLFPDLDVLTNLFLPEEPQWRGLIDRSAMQRRADHVLASMELDVDLRSPVGQLSLAQRQLLEICRALVHEPKVLILDEPNSALQADATTRLLGVVRSLRARGTGVVYVSHLLEEVFSVADTLTVIRDGAVAAARLPVAETSIAHVVETMLGARSSAAGLRVAAEKGDSGTARAPLRVSEIAVRGVLHPVSLTAEPGEVVGLAGLDGSGTKALMEVLFGRRRATSGHIDLPSGATSPNSVAAAVRAGVAFVPADRKGCGVMLDKSIAENVCSVQPVVLGSALRLIGPRHRAERAAARIRQLAIKASSVDTPVGHLSGGNQQKVVFAKWLEATPNLILLDDPTRGVDVGAKAEMHQVIRQLAALDRVVVVASSDLDELSTLCDRVLVLHRGSLALELVGEQLTEHSLLEAINTGRLGTATVM